jgi:hypothetical protein
MILLRLALTVGLVGAVVGMLAGTYVPLAVVAIVVIVVSPLLSSRHTDTTGWTRYK